MREFMVDIETLGNSSNSVILQIGACEFNPKTGKIKNEFIVDITQSSCYNLGLLKDKSTAKWWKEQSDEAKEKVFAKDIKRVSIKKAMKMFTDFINAGDDSDGDVRIWCHTSFDFPILDNVYRKLEMKNPFKFWNMVDMRTIKFIAHLKGLKKYPSNKKVAHYTLDDCRWQIKYCVYYLKRLEMKVQ